VSSDRTQVPAQLTRTVDFGAPAADGEHMFHVEVPASRKDPVLIVEDFGFRGQDAGLQDEPRAVVKRANWLAIADAARRDFNERLKAAEHPTGRWHTGSNLVERLLGKELCVLAWATETASADETLIICSKWAALRPEERWWLFSMTVAEAGLPQDTKRGWRRALYYALSDGERPARGRRRLPADPDDFTALYLFEEPS
jgi:Protein of unknown function (DUF3780)